MSVKTYNLETYIYKHIRDHGKSIWNCINKAGSLSIGLVSNNKLVIYAAFVNMRLLTI